MLLLPLLGTAVLAGTGVLPDGHLDMPALRKMYMESDFEPVRNTLEKFNKTAWDGATRDERVFTHIYLGVIYAADSILDAAAESHFNALLDIAPNIELVDMFVPPKIQNTFDRVKRDFLRMKEYARKYDALGNPLAAESVGGMEEKRTVKQPAVTRESSDRQWVWWTLGAAGALGAGVGVYFLTTTSESPTSNQTKVDCCPE